MRKSLGDAIAGYSRNKGVLRVGRPQVNQRVIALVGNEYGIYIPTLATVTKVNPRTADVLLYCTGDDAKRVDHGALFSDGYSWCIGRHGEPFACASLSGTHECWMGTVYIDRRPYVRRYPEVDYETGDLSWAQVYADWKAAPDAFVLEEA